MGVAAAGGTAEQADAAQRYADALGLAFQIRDDMLDVIGDEATFGKPSARTRRRKRPPSSISSALRRANERSCV